ncbi:MAG: hypothetical protein QME81_20560, partial [bacterium]|nr:hypothetical protein [bacterium]
TTYNLFKITIYDRAEYSCRACSAKTSSKLDHYKLAQPNLLPKVIEKIPEKGLSIAFKMPIK